MNVVVRHRSSIHPGWSWLRIIREPRPGRWAAVARLATQIGVSIRLIETLAIPRISAVGDAVRHIPTWAEARPDRLVGTMREA